MRIKGTVTLGDQHAGTDGNDLFIGSGTADEFYGQYGRDRMEGKAGDDRLNGGDDADRIFGGRGNDSLDGDGGYGNRLEGGTGNDWLNCDLLNGNWSELVGGRGADTFDIGIEEAYSKVEAPGVRAWADIRDFNAAQGDKIGLGVDAAIGTREVIAFFDSDHNGRIDNGDDAAVWDGRTLQIATETATVVLWGQDHLDWAMLAI